MPEGPGRRIGSRLRLLVERGWADALCVGFIAAGTWACWTRFSTAGRDIPGRMPFRLTSDFFNTYIPMTEAAGVRLRAGELPLWNPDACSGIPFLATLQTGVLYPPTWLAVLWPAHVLLPWLVILHCLLGGVFAFALFRAWSCERAAASAGALLFVFSCCIGQTMWPPAIATICWVPFLLLACEKLARGGGVGWWLGLVVGAALQALAGFPQYLLYGYGIVLPYALLRSARDQAETVGARVRGLRLLAMASAIGLGFGLACIQLLPSAELVQQSARAEALTPAQAHYLYPAERFASSGHVLAQTLDGSPAALSLGERGSGYLGIVSLLFLASALVLRWRESLVWGLLALAGVSLVLSDGYLGGGPQLYAAFAEIPILGSLRTPERLRLVTFLCASGLVALGFSALAATVDSRARQRVATFTLLIAAVALALGCVTLLKDAAAARSLLTLALSLALCLAVVWAATPRLRAGVCALLLVLLALDLSVATATRATLRDIPQAWVGHYRHGGEILSEDRQRQLREQAGSGRLVLRSMLPTTGNGGPNALRRISCVEPLVPAQWTLLARGLGEGREGRIALSDLHGEAVSKIYDLASVRGSVAFSDGAFRLEENSDALPRAYFLRETRVATQAEAIERLARGELQPRRETLVEQEVDLGPATQLREGGSQPIPARVLEDTPERVVLGLDAPTTGLLVLTDTHYPGWVASIDGVPARIGRANGLHRFVVVAPGRHRVVFAYRPASFRTGALVSGASFLVALAVVVAARRSRTRRR